MALPHPATRVHLLTLTALCPSLVSGERGTGAAQKGNSYTLKLGDIELIKKALFRQANSYSIDIDPNILVVLHR
jgi:hypothetical protein